MRKANRKEKFYECNNCMSVLDADINASINHSIELPEIPYDFRGRNRGAGFFWKEDGFFDFDGRSLQSLPPV